MQGKQSECRASRATCRAAPLAHTFLDLTALCRGTPQIAATSSLGGRTRATAAAGICGGQLRDSGAVGAVSPLRPQGADGAAPRSREAPL